jgi:hypothetical protein
MLYIRGTRDGLWDSAVWLEFGELESMEALSLCLWGTRL